jgi:hypothetical protein
VSFDLALFGPVYLALLPLFLEYCERKSEKPEALIPSSGVLTVNKSSSALIEGIALPLEIVLSVSCVP